ncbi:hypothetical protein [Metabacillus fastidiosus]|uniref:Uncharacterized protein n=1 Tax=Metabacillus fastidiosus TaxID=1458 RepID=A0ABU6NT03_9BACI|nr:hypothetical protein [Metabacillus fastidiosus]MED4400275.1 hypothetical protein [Metabacillus fastidiosus]
MAIVVKIDDTKHVEVTKFEGDLQVGTRKMYLDDYLASVLGSMNEQELLSFLFSKEYIETITEYIENVEDKEVFSKIMKLVLDKVERQSDSLETNELFVSLLYQLLERINLHVIDPNWLKDVLHAVFKNIDDISVDVTEYQQLLLLLLNKAEVNAEMSSSTLSKILDVASNKVSITENQEELKQLFLSIAEKAKGDWIDKVLSTVAPNRVLFNGFMPKNVLYYHKTLNSEVVVIDVPKNQFNVKFHDVNYSNVGHPRMLFYFRVINQRIASIKIACVRDKIINEETQLYLYPYSNVYSNHTICWSYGHYEIDSLEKLQHIPYIFLSTPNNSHINSYTRQLFEDNSEKEFNDEELKPSDYTFKDFVALEQ